MINKGIIILFIWTIVGFVLGIVIPAISRDKSIFTFAPIFAFFVFLYLDIYIHEFGHVLSGKIVKFPIKRITIGTGREIIRKKIGEMLLVITSGYGGGMIHIGSVSRQFIKLRFFIFILGGVALQFFTICVLLVISNIDFSELLNIKQLSFTHAFIYSNLLLIILNVYPRKVMMMGVPILNDGAQLLKLPFLKPYDILEILAAGKVIETYELFEAKQYSEAENGFKECIKNYPSLLIPKINLSAIHLRRFKLDKTISYLEPILKEYHHDQYVFFIYNNLAWAYFLKFNDQALKKADEYSEKAMECNSQNKSILNTRGCILIEKKGVIENGISCLKQTIKIRKAMDEKTNHPISFLALAYGYYLKNEFPKALQYMKKFETYGEALDRDGQAYYDHIMSKTDNFHQYS